MLERDLLIPIELHLNQPETLKEDKKNSQENR